MTTLQPTGQKILPGMDAVLFDLDGVLTPTAAFHRKAWAAMFSQFFAQQGVTPPYTDQDYFTYVDGKPRFNGVADLLAARGVVLPFGRVDDPPGDTTVTALGNKKNQAFNQILLEEHIEPYPGSVELLDGLAEQGSQVAVVSSSANARAVLESAGLLRCFRVIVDGQVAAAEQLPGKPAPDTFLYGANQLGVAPELCAVVEDATSGVAAGRAGGFGLVIGVDRGTGQAALEAAGADLVVHELTELLPTHT
ncbi:MAG: beta-phosphoglucomutase family hydrolase [Micrococcales bacterium]|nr:beta-phosphoglucomutase family hydrolase [Micrococcales bacterium]